MWLCIALGSNLRRIQFDLPSRLRLHPGFVDLDGYLEVYSPSMIEYCLQMLISRVRDLGETIQV